MARLRLALAGDGLAAEWTPIWIARLRELVEIVAVRDAPDIVVAADLDAARSAQDSGARYGIVACMFGDPPAGKLPGRADIALGSRTTSARLLHLAPPFTTGRVLRNATVQTVGHDPTATRERLLEACATWPADLCRDLLVHGEAALRGPPVTLLPKATPPSALRVALGRGKGALRKLRQDAGQETWNIGIVAKPAHAFLTDSQPVPIRWLPELLPGGYFADPFPFMADGRLQLLAEGYDYDERVGYLAHIDLDDPSGIAVTRLATPLSGHLSYPYLIEDEGSVFMVPESHQSRQVMLLRADPFPHRWIRHRILLDGFAGVDTTIVRHGGRWWMFCGNHDDQDQTKLYLFLADRLEGPWQPHQRNPVKVDCRSSRPGGKPFVHNGVLYRPAQDCSRTYGGAITLNRVLTLTPERFLEETAVRIDPDANSRYPHGLHHFVPFGDVTVIDAKRQRFGPVTLASWLRNRISGPRSRSER